ncbi:MAG: hypothetical protein SGJ19_23140 [Planctomycetia bacterium]|nr:hypothetical protein [Planctomycetia bacterium]
MVSENPYESPRSQDSNGVQSETPSLGFRCLRAIVLGTLGYSAYAVAQTINMPTRYWYANLFHPLYLIGLNVAAAFAGSELLVADAWSLRSSVLRRIIVSSLLMLPACLIGGAIGEVFARPLPNNMMIHDSRPAVFVSVVTGLILMLCARMYLRRSSRPLH